VSPFKALVQWMESVGLCFRAATGLGEKVKWIGRLIPLREALAIALNPHLRAEAGLVCAWIRSVGFRRVKERCLSGMGWRTAAPGANTT
jgi:hypothetical protein